MCVHKDNINVMSPSCFLCHLAHVRVQRRKRKGKDEILMNIQRFFLLILIRKSQNLLHDLFDFKRKLCVELAPRFQRNSWSKLICKKLAAQEHSARCRVNTITLKRAKTNLFISEKHLNSKQLASIARFTETRRPSHTITIRSLDLFSFNLSIHVVNVCSSTTA